MNLLLAAKGVLLNFIFFSIVYAALIGLGISVLAAISFALGSAIN